MGNPSVLGAFRVGVIIRYIDIQKKREILQASTETTDANSQKRSVPATGIPEPKATVICIPKSPTRINNVAKVLVRESSASI